MILRRETNIYDDEAIKNSIASVDKKFSATYGTCSTEASTVAKVVTLADFVLFKGAQISVHFTYNNTASAPTLNVNGTGAKAIWARGAAIAATYYWSANSTHTFTYDGTHWVLENAESQEEVYKRLTNNGQNTGLYLENGSLYMNATYIHSGTLSANYIYGGTLKLGGTASGTGGDGVLNVYNASGTLIGKWDKNGIEVLSGSINGATVIVGGNNNANGSLTVKNSSGNTIGKWDVNGLEASELFKLSKKPSGNNNTYYVQLGEITVYSGFASGVHGGLRLYTDNSNTGELTISPARIINHLSTMPDYAAFVSASSNIAIMSRNKTSGDSAQILIQPDQFTLYLNRASNRTSYFPLIVSYDTTKSRNYGRLNGRWEYNAREIAVTSSSSKRFKHNITSVINKDMDAHRLYNLQMKQFVYNDDHPTQYTDMKGQTIPGFIAEDVAEIYPAAAIHDADGNVESWDERRIIPAMLKLIQEQHEEIAKLKQVIHVA